MKEFFGKLPNGEEASLYTIACGGITAAVTDYGANLVRLLVPDRNGCLADVVLGYDDCNGYRVTNGAALGATVGRNSNRLKDASFQLNGVVYRIPQNEGTKNLHSGPDFYFQRMWKAVEHTETSLTLELNSPDGDQGFPGNALIHVTYSLDDQGGLHIVYDATCDQDTVFNMTNHSYFNLAGHDRTDKAMEQHLMIAGRFFNPDDAENIPTGVLPSPSAETSAWTMSLCTCRAAMTTTGKFTATPAPFCPIPFPAESWKFTPTAPVCSSTQATIWTKPARAVSITANAPVLHWRPSSGPTVCTIPTGPSPSSGPARSTTAKPSIVSLSDIPIV